MDETHSLQGIIKVNTTRVNLIAPIRSKITRLISEGIDVRSYNPVYRFTKLNEIKPEMLREAAQNARTAATEFAKNAGVKVGSIRSARQGNFTIRDFGEDYGDTKKLTKNVRVVTRIEFYLK